jgi:hypothetical protein
MRTPESRPFIRGYRDAFEGSGALNVSHAAQA